MVSQRRALAASTRELLEVLDHHALGGDRWSGEAAAWIREHELDALNLAAWRDAAQSLAAVLNADEVDLPEGKLRDEIRSRGELARAWVNDQPEPVPTIVLDRAAALDALAVLWPAASGGYAKTSRDVVRVLTEASIDRARS